MEELGFAHNVVGVVLSRCAIKECKTTNTPGQISIPGTTGPGGPGITVVSDLTCKGAEYVIWERAVIPSGWALFLISLGGQAPHMLRAHMGHTCGEPNEIELTVAHRLLNVALLGTTSTTAVHAALAASNAR